MKRDLNNKIISLRNEIIEQDKRLGIIGDRDFISVQIFQKIDCLQRGELIAEVQKIFKPTKNIRLLQSRCVELISKCKEVL